MQELYLYNCALQYLRERINEDTLDHYLNLYRFNSLNSLEEAYERILESAKERQHLPNSIGSLDPLKSILFNFQPNVIVTNFENWETVFNTIHQSNYTPPGRMDFSNNKNAWVLFSKSILTGAKFLSRFQTIEDFKSYCNSFIQGNPDIRIAFPLLLSEEIKGFGFALACNFLKEWVSPEFVKPDTHTKEIFIGTGFAQQSDSDFNICRRMINFSAAIKEIPYSVDKVFWLIGSGKLHKTYLRKHDEYFQTSKQEFIRLYNQSEKPTANKSIATNGA